MARLFNVVENKVPSILLKDRFIVPPFSVFDTKQGYWQDRKRRWLALGIKSEVGRGEKLLYGIGHFNYDDEVKENYARQKMALEGVGCTGAKAENYGRKAQQTSVFDPVVCEIAYKWFSLPNAKILDPFAGGSVRGLIAGMIGRHYTGVDLSEIQIDANKKQYKEISAKYTGIVKPHWINGDSMNIKKLVAPEKAFDMIFSCPPYYNLEVYSNKEEDLSNMATYEEFLEGYNAIIYNCCELLKDNSFAIFVVGNMRDKTGCYYDFVGDTIKAFEAAGARLYNEAIIVNVAGTLPVRTPIQFNSSRKFGKQHQQFLVFYKGDTSKIHDKYGDFETK